MLLVVLGDAASLFVGRYKVSAVYV